MLELAPELIELELERDGDELLEELEELEELPPPPRTSLRTLESFPARAIPGTIHAKSTVRIQAVGPMYRPSLAILVFKMTQMTRRR